GGRFFVGGRASARLGGAAQSPPSLPLPLPFPSPLPLLSPPWLSWGAGGGSALGGVLAAGARGDGEATPAVGPGPRAAAKTRPARSTPTMRIEMGSASQAERARPSRVGRAAGRGVAP